MRRLVENRFQEHLKLLNVRNDDVVVDIWPYTLGAGAQTRMAGTLTPGGRMRRRVDVPLQPVAVDG